MKLLKAIGAGGLVFLWAYLIGAFATASFDISTWSDVARGYTSIMGGGLSFMATMFVMSEVV